MSNPWLSWHDLANKTIDSSVYLYGRSEDWVHKAVSQFANNIIAIIDRDPSFEGTKYCGLPVFPYEQISTQFESNIFIITAGDYGGILELLESNGYELGVSIFFSPDFKDYQVLERIKACQRTILFTSSDYNDRLRARSSWLGGGLYKYETLSGQLTKVFSASLRQFVYLKDARVAAVDYVDKRLLIFNPDLTLDFSIGLDQPNFCGIAYCNQSDRLTLVNAATDQIVTFDCETWKIIGSRKFNPSILHGSHHVNDCCYNNGMFYCSYFSSTGSYKIDVFDGGVAFLDPKSSDAPTQVIGNLWKPHSPLFIDNKLHVLDSMRGKLASGKNSSIAYFPGFVRGLASDPHFLCIGQSEDMYVSERMLHETIMLNAGIYLYDREYGAARFISMPNLMNIHCIAFC